VTDAVFYTAATIDGFIADEHDSLDWLFEHDTGDSEGGPPGYDEFIAGIGALAMGATTYEWLRAHLERTGEAWPYDQPTWVFTHRDLPAVAPEVRFVQGDVAEHWDAMASAAGDRDVWVVGGGELAGQYADAGLLTRLEVQLAPVTLGAGKPLFPRQHDLELVDVGRSGDFVVATYAVRGPRGEAQKTS
jgi:dihydrofolate reductase